MDTDAAMVSSILRGYEEGREGVIGTKIL